MLEFGSEAVAIFGSGSGFDVSFSGLAIAPGLCDCSAGYRIIQDFRELHQKSFMNKCTIKDIYECIGDIGQAESTIFSTLSLLQDFGKCPFLRISSKDSFHIARSWLI